MHTSGTSTQRQLRPKFAEGQRQPGISQLNKFIHIYLGTNAPLGLQTRFTYTALVDVDCLDQLLEQQMISEISPVHTSVVFVSASFSRESVAGIHARRSVQSLVD